MHRTSYSLAIIMCLSIAMIIRPSSPQSHTDTVSCATKLDELRGKLRLARMALQEYPKIFCDPGSEELSILLGEIEENEKRRQPLLEDIADIQAQIACHEWLRGFALLQNN